MQISLSIEQVGSKQSLCHLLNMESSVNGNDAEPEVVLVLTPGISVGPCSQRRLSQGLPASSVPGQGHGGQAQRGADTFPWCCWGLAASHLGQVAWPGCVQPSPVRLLQKQLVLWALLHSKPTWKSDLAF